MKKREKQRETSGRPDKGPPARPATRKPARSTQRPSIVSPRDERGAPYPGDFPNPLRGKLRDCF